MREKLRHIFLVLIFCYFPSYAQEFSAAILNTCPAFTLSKGQLLLGIKSHIFFKNLYGIDDLGLATAATYWDLQSSVSAHIGFTNHLEFAVDQILYQDNHKAGAGYNLPDDLFFSAKLAAFGRDDSKYRFGILCNSRIPLARYHNIPLEPYSAGRVALGLSALMSWGENPPFFASGTNYHVNLGIFSHNDIMANLSGVRGDSLLVQQNTREFVFSFALIHQAVPIGFFAEINGRSFLRRPPVNAFTRENTLFLTPGLVFTPNSWIRLHVVFDLLVTGEQEESKFNGEQGSLLSRPWPADLNMPAWRMKIGITFAPLYKKTMRKRNMLVPEKKPELLSQEEKIYTHLADERRKTDREEEELERITQERERMQQMLEKIKRMLEPETKPD